MKNSKKITLVFLNGISNAGGAERMTFYLYQYFNFKGYDVEILDEKKLKNTFLGKLYWKLFKIKRFEKRRLKYIARFATAYLWLTSANRMIISNGEPTAYYPTDVVISHGCNHKMELDYGKTDNQFTRTSKLQKKACENAKKIIAVAESVKNDLINFYKINDTKITVIPNCIDTQYFYPISREKPNFKTIVYIGRLEIGKGLKELVELSKMVESKVDWKLIIVSNNSINTEIFDHLRNTEILVDIDVDKINELGYSKADMVYYPSHSESFGMVTIEALSCGKPIIGNSVGVLPELVYQKFPGTYLLPNDGNADLLDIIEQCIVDSKKFTPEEIHQKAKEKFSIEAYYKDLDKFFA